MIGAWNAVAFLLRHWRLILILLVVGVVFWGLTLWDGPFGFGKSRDALVLEGEIARDEVEVQKTINDRDADLSEIARNLSVLRAQIALLSDQGHDDIEAARPAHEEALDAELVRSWRGSIERLRDAASADAPSADPGNGGSAG